MRAVLMLLAVWMMALPVVAHEITPARLDIREVADNAYDVRLRAPLRRGTPLALSPVFPEDCAAGPLSRTRDASGIVQSARMTCAASLSGRAISLRGLERAGTDVLVSFTPREGRTQSLRVLPDDPTLTLPERAGAGATFLNYLRFGFIHIFEGPDHLAFVFGLLLLVSGAGALVKAVTAFTLAHSLTLAATVLGFAGLSPGAVEALIAVSIVLLAAEVLRGGDTLARRRPWVVAFAFGLLHGFGFAGALAEIGLPEGQVPLALLAFNLGIEAGQLAFVAVVSALVLWPLSKLDWRGLADRVAAYGLGGIAMAWTLARLATL